AGGEFPPALEGCALSSPLDGGLARCQGGLLHRPMAGAECSNRLPREQAFAPEVLFELEQRARAAGYPESEIPSLYVCRQDTDCTAQPNGYCDRLEPYDWSFGAPFTTCRYACSSDADCGGGTLCQCGEPAGQCVSATCFEDGECGDGLFCTRYEAFPGCGTPPVWIWECQELADECGSDADCGASEVCLFVDGRHACTTPTCG
ncbi:MAG TPA: hypothetical protein VMG12_20420, partial [Polyangiaceae bacterium]|nr:hypothetical protein [Polyangiaceae bacterium]